MELNLTIADCNTLQIMFWELECEQSHNQNYRTQSHLMRKICYWRGFFDALSDTKLNPDDELEPIIVSNDEYKYICDSIENFSQTTTNNTHKSRALAILDKCKNP